MSRDPTEEPYATDHFHLRWFSRTNDFRSDALHSAWRDSIEVHVEGRTYDEARLHEEHNVILLAKDGAIQTVLHADTEDYVLIDEMMVTKCEICGEHVEIGEVDEECPKCHSRGDWEDAELKARRQGE